MSINNVGGPTGPRGTQQLDRPATPAAGQAAAGAPARATDEVALTDRAAQLRELTAAVPREAPFDEQRVEALRTAIAEGRYPVDSTRLAEKLLAAEQDLFG